MSTRTVAHARLRRPTPELLALPWESPLGEWDPTTVPFRDVPVGPSRHLVRFVELPDGLLAIKEASAWVVRREYEMLCALEARGLPAVRPVGVAVTGSGQDGVLVTRFLDHSWQYRRLFMRLPHGASPQRDRLLRGLAGLLVELHRSGIFWGDCSLANTLFIPDGQMLQAYLVDAETSEAHASLSDGQRAHDIEIAVENLAAGLIDVARRIGQTELGFESECILAAESVAALYSELWDELHPDLVIAADERWRVTTQVRRLHDLGYAVDEVKLELDDESEGGERLRVDMVVATGRSRYSEELRELTGLAVRDGQAKVLLADLHAFMERQPELPSAAARWVSEVFRLGLAAVRESGSLYTDPVQAFCDLIEVSGHTGVEVGLEEALPGLRDRDAIPPDATASMAEDDQPERRSEL